MKIEIVKVNKPAVKKMPEKKELAKQEQVQESKEYTPRMHLKPALPKFNNLSRSRKNSPNNKRSDRKQKSPPVQQSFD